MINQIDLYNKRKKYIKEKRELESQLKSNKEGLIDLQNQCNHEIVLSFCDHKSRMVGNITKCLCPACFKYEEIYECHEKEKTSFKDSKIIDFTEYPINFVRANLSTILECICDNIDYFYGDDRSDKVDLILETINKKEEYDNFIRKLNKEST